MAKNHYVSGGFNVICDVCAKKVKASEAKHRWDGLVVCPDDYEQRQPQDFVKARQDKITIPFSRPRPPDVFRPELFVVPLDERLYLTDSLYTQILYNVSALDTLLLNDSIEVTIGKGVLDTITITDTLDYTHEIVPGVTDYITTIDTIYIHGVFGPVLNGAPINSTTLG